MAHQLCLVSYTICYAELIDHKIKIDSLVGHIFTILHPLSYVVVIRASSGTAYNVLITGMECSYIQPN